MARVMYIMWEHEPEIIKAAHGVDGDEEVKKSTSTSTLTLADVGFSPGVADRTLPLDACRFFFLSHKVKERWSVDTASILFCTSTYHCFLSVSLTKQLMGCFPAARLAPRPPALQNRGATSM